jgi:hypothetical protein
VELIIPTRQLFFSNALNVPMVNDSCKKENLEVHNVVKYNLNLLEGGILNYTYQQTARHERKTNIN